MNSSTIKHLLLTILIALLGFSQACTAADTPAVPTMPSASATEIVTATPRQPTPPLSGKVIPPADLTYLGAFRLPASNDGWDYSGQGLTYNPQGDSRGPKDGFPGSLFGFGHDQRMLVSEINIPAPIISQNLDDLNIAETLQPFADITGGLFDFEAIDIPRAGLAYLPPQGAQKTPNLHFAIGWHFQKSGDPSHGWSELDLSHPQTAGPWVFDGFSNYVTDDYLFEIPQPWADAIGPEMRLATGRAREGPWSGLGPALFAYAPWRDGNPPAKGATLHSIAPLLLYGEQAPGEIDIATKQDRAMKDYGDSDHWMGGAWLTAGDKAAVIFVGTKALGRSWYGFDNGVVWDYDCAEQSPPTCPDVPEWPHDNRGYWAEDYQAQIIFYDPADLVAVAHGEKASWEPQPYATLPLDDHLFDPKLRPEDYKRDLVGAVAFDRARGFLYVMERLADEYRSVVHVWQVQP